uniref:Uncharacterized protein n=1 Tax=Suricata suricatta TaxID=37032 RepID=A0A673V033_SURSU
MEHDSGGADNGLWLPMVEQTLEAVWETPAKDPIFTPLVPENSPGFSGRAEHTEAQLGQLSQQRLAYMAMNPQLWEVHNGLRQKCEDLQLAGEELEHEIPSATGRLTMIL